VCSSYAFLRLERSLLRWIGRGTDDDQMLLAWPPRSPDATPCDFFIWSYVKDQVYVPPLPASIQELKVRIRTAIETITADMLQTILIVVFPCMLIITHLLFQQNALVFIKSTRYYNSYLLSLYS
jgi:hypothetical protein